MRSKVTSSLSAGSFGRRQSGEGSLPDHACFARKRYLRAIARYKIIVQFLWKLKQAKISTYFFKERKRGQQKGTVLLINKGPRCTVLTFNNTDKGKKYLRKGKKWAKNFFITIFTCGEADKS